MGLQAENKSYNGLQTKSELRLWSKQCLSHTLEFNQQYLETFLQQFSQPGQFWGGFKTLAPEPEIDWSLLAKKFQIKWLYPKIQDQDMVFVQASEFSLNPNYKVYEPKDGLEIVKSQISGLVIPGLAFDNRGYRLGRGKGYYDRYLQNFKGIKVGVCHREQFLLRPIPVDKWDLMMDFVITNEFIFKAENIKASE